MGKLSRDSDRDRKLSHKFAQMYLRQDGVFVLKLVAKNSTDLVVADIVSALWDNYKNKPIFGTRNDDLDVEIGGEMSWLYAIEFANRSREWPKLTKHVCLTDFTCAS